MMNPKPSSDGSADSHERLPMATPTADDALLRLLGVARAAPPTVGEWIGPYELLEEIGRGSASVVFRARQRRPIARELAIKILVEPAVSASVASRFRIERALLARLRHRSIVSIIDAGETTPGDGAVGVPWFAMPFVAGEPIDRWCGRVGASTTLRLRVLEEVAAAVKAAHAIGVVHRDLKPSNILVSGSADAFEVQVIDFGIAKVLDDGALDADAHSAIDGTTNATISDTTRQHTTRVGAVVGTPEFMSPEQANLDASRVGPASDVYALGLVACVLLAGRAPGVERTSREHHMPIGPRLRMAAERVVPPLSQLAQNRAFRGEIEWIVAKACAQEIAQRYPDARAFADDLARLREGQPIMAAPKDSGYAVSFVLRKHRVALTALGLFVVLLVSALSVYSRHESNRAQAEIARNQQLSELLTRARTQLRPITGKSRGDIVDDPKAIELMETLHAINCEVLGIDGAESQQSALILARGYDRADRWIEAEPLYRAMLVNAEAKGTRQGDVAFLQTMLGGNLRRQGVTRAKEAHAYFDLALAFWATHSNPPFSRCTVPVERSFVYRLEGNTVAQRASLEEGIALTEAATSPGHQQRRHVYSFMGDFLREQKDFDGALEWYEKAMAGLPEVAAAGTPEAADPERRIQDVWRDGARAEVLWITRERARTAAGSEVAPAFDPQLDAELKAIIARYEAHDPTNVDLPRWR